MTLEEILGPIPPEILAELDEAMRRIREAEDKAARDAWKVIIRG